MEFEVLETLWFGDFSDEEAEQEAQHSLAARIGQIHGLLPFPATARRLLAAIQEPDYAVGRVATIIEADAALTTRILRLVNSAAYGLKARCTTIPHALTLLGAKTIGEIGMAVVMLEMFQDETGAGQQIQTHLLTVAALSRILAVHCGHPTDDVYTCGLLHDIGKLLLLQVERQRYHEVLVSLPRERDSAHLREREEFHYDHAVLGAHVLDAWKIPDPVPTVVAWHHQMARAHRAGGRHAVLAALVRVADHLSYEIGNLDDKPATAALVKDESAAYIGLTEENLAGMWDDLATTHMQCTTSP